MNRKYVVVDAMTKRVVIQCPDDSNSLMLAPEPTFEEMMKGNQGTAWEDGFIFDNEKNAKKMAKKFGKDFMIWPLKEKNGKYSPMALSEL